MVTFQEWVWRRSDEDGRMHACIAGEPGQWLTGCGRVIVDSKTLSIHDGVGHKGWCLECDANRRKVALRTTHESKR